MIPAQQDFDELLSGYIDGELSERQCIEIKRLLAKDPEVCRRMDQLQKCRILLTSLPPAEAPARVLQSVRAAIAARSIPVNHEIDRSEQRRGVRGLRVRRFVAAAAMVGLVAVLGAIIYAVLVPEYPKQRRFDNQEYARVSSQQLHPTRVEATGNSKVPTEQPLMATVRLAGFPYESVSAYVNRIIEQNGLLARVGEEITADSRAYTVSGSPQAVRMLLTDLEGIWNKLEECELVLVTDSAGGSLALDGLEIKQIVEVLSQDSRERAVAIARDLAALNSIGRLASGVLVPPSDPLEMPAVIPKPVLTGKHQPSHSRLAAEQTDSSNRLKIVIVNARP